MDRENINKWNEMAICKSTNYTRKWSGLSRNELDQPGLEHLVNYMPHRYTWVHYVGVGAAKTTLYAKGDLKLLLEVKLCLEQF